LKKIRMALGIATFLPATVLADPYIVLGFDGVLGKEGYPSNDSLMIAAGVGADTKIGWFIEFIGTLNVKEIAFDNPTQDRNQHIAYFMPVTGYKLKINSDHYLKANVGYQAGFFEKRCQYSDQVAKEVCDPSEDYGPAYGVGYYYSGRSRSLIGVEFRRYDLSDSRQYNAISLSINGFFR